MAAFDDPITTERLVLRPFRADDAQDVNAFQAAPGIMRYLYWGVRTPEHSRTWVKERMAATRLTEDDDGVALAVERQDDGRVIGSVNVWIRSVEHKQGEVGFVFATDVQRRGYAAEAMSAFLDAIFPVLDLHRVFGTTDARNDASAGL